jgi:23S rRNA pseudouridine1911/1915/1917 synthase
MIMAEDEVIVDADGEDQPDELVEQFRFKVDKGQETIRIDKFLASRLDKNISRTRIQNAADAGSILVNGKAIKPNYKIRPEDDIQIILPKTSDPYELLPENIPLDIIYEDDQLLVINKQPGLVCHPGLGNHNGTLINALLYHFAGLPKGKQEFRPGLVHRIDKDTSGLMVIAKTEFALVHLSKQFFDRTIQRLYKALAWGNIEEDTGTIEGNIGRHSRDRLQFEVFPEGDFGKHAVTHYKVLERLNYVTLVQCKLETGRTHQIRVHMKYIGHTLFNDRRYGGDAILKGTIYSKYKQFIHNCFEILPRQALHAATLGFVHPTTGKQMSFEQPLPADFAGALDKWRKYWQTMEQRMDNEE